MKRKVCTHCYKTMKKIQNHSLTILAQNQEFSSLEQTKCRRKRSIHTLWIKTLSFWARSVLHSWKTATRLEKENEWVSECEREREREKGRETEKFRKKMTRTVFSFCYEPKRIQNHSLYVTGSKSQAFINWTTEAQKNAPRENQEEHQNLTSNVRSI